MTTTLPAWLIQLRKRASHSSLRLILLVALASIALAMFGGILQGIGEPGQVAQFDQAIQSRVISWRQPALTVLLEIVTGVAGVKGNLVFIGLSALLLWRRRVWRLAAILVAGAAVQALLVVVIKVLVARPRPALALRLIHETSFSFPSGHTLGAVVIVGLLCYLLGRTVQRGWLRWMILGLWFVWILVVAVSRIYLGVHYPSDTAASACLGGIVLSLFYSYRILSGQDLAAAAAHNTGVRWRLLAAMALTFLIVSLDRSLFT